MRDLASQPYRGAGSHPQVTNLLPSGQTWSYQLRPARQLHIWPFVRKYGQIFPGSICWCHQQTCTIQIWSDGSYQCRSPQTSPDVFIVWQIITDTEEDTTLLPLSVTHQWTVPTRQLLSPLHLYQISLKKTWVASPPGKGFASNENERQGTQCLCPPITWLWSYYVSPYLTVLMISDSFNRWLFLFMKPCCKHWPCCSCICHNVWSCTSTLSSCRWFDKTLHSPPPTRALPGMIRDNRVLREKHTYGRSDMLVFLK